MAENTRILVVSVLGGYGEIMKLLRLIGADFAFNGELEYTH